MRRTRELSTHILYFILFRNQRLSISNPQTHCYQERTREREMISFMWYIKLKRPTCTPTKLHTYKKGNIKNWHKTNDESLRAKPGERPALVASRSKRIRGGGTNLTHIDEWEESERILALFDALQQIYEREMREKCKNAVLWKRDFDFFLRSFCDFFWVARRTDTSHWNVNWLVGFVSPLLKIPNSALQKQKFT